MADSAVRVETRPDGVAVLTIDQPGSRANVLTAQLWTELEAAITALANQADLRGLVIVSGKPGMFVAGADLKFFAAVPAPNDPAVKQVIEHGLRVLDRLEALPFPTCAAIDGPALGGGLEVALACDFRVCGSHPRVELGLPEVKLGLIPGWGGTQRLPRIVGMAKAAEMLGTATSVDATEAVRIGLATTGDPFERVLTGDNTEIRARKRSPIPAGSRPPVPSSPNAVREAMLVLTRGADLPLAEAIPMETEAFLRLAGSDESKKLIADFFASRKK